MRITRNVWNGGDFGNNLLEVEVIPSSSKTKAKDMTPQVVENSGIVCTALQLKHM